MFWPKLVLAKLGLAKVGAGQTWFGQSWCWPNLVWPKLVLAKDGLAKFGKTRWPNLVLATVGNALGSTVSSTFFLTSDLSLFGGKPVKDKIGPSISSGRSIPLLEATALVVVEAESDGSLETVVLEDNDASDSGVSCLR